MAKQPEKIDKYGEISLLARGGMGAVYTAVHPTLERPVVLKKLTLRGQSSFAARFKREARILMDFRHDDIVTVFDHFKQGSSYYIVMEYIEGASLEGLLREYRYIESPIAAYIMLHAAKAIGYAHNRGVVHRDIKPANILISREGSIKLADFGIAASADDADSDLTGEGMTLGTPSYMAPEQFENSRNVDSKADIYALGVMAYEISTGKRPFSGGFSPELIKMKQKGRYPSPRKFVPSIAKPLIRIIKGAMRTSRRRRFTSVDPIIKNAEKILSHYENTEIKDILGAMVRGERDIRIPETKKRPARTVLRWALACVAGALFVWGLFAATIVQPIFSGQDHGRLRLSVEVSESAGFHGRTQMEALLIASDSGSVSKTIQPSLIPVPWKNDQSTKHYTTLPLYIPSGMYELQLRYEGRVIIDSMYLPPLRSQQNFLDFHQTIREIRVQRSLSRPVKVDLSAHDALSGKQLHDGLSLFVETPEGRVPYDEAEQLVSGKTYRFLSVADGYLPGYFSASIDHEETYISLDAALLPKPALINLTDIPGDFTISLNNSPSITTYQAAGDSSGNRYSIERLKLDTVRNEERIMIPPGNYRFSIERRNNRSLLNVNIDSGDFVVLHVDENNETPVLNAGHKW